MGVLLFTDKRKLYVSGEVDDNMFMGIRHGLAVMCETSTDPITIELTTEGGCCVSAMGIVKAIRSCPADVIIEAHAFVWSAGVYILQSGDVRKMSKEATLMVHRGEEETTGDRETMRAWDKFNDKVERQMHNILCSRTQKDKLFWDREFAKGDRIFEWQEAKRHRLIDEAF